MKTAKAIQLLSFVIICSSNSALTHQLTSRDLSLESMPQLEPDYIKGAIKAIRQLRTGKNSQLLAFPRLSALNSIACCYDGINYSRLV
jgi:hypothetical protein